MTAGYLPWKIEGSVGHRALLDYKTRNEKLVDVEKEKEKGMVSIAKNRERIIIINKK